MLVEKAVADKAVVEKVLVKVLAKALTEKPKQTRGERSAACF
jgi:hypothetical protein